MALVNKINELSEAGLKVSDIVSKYPKHRIECFDLSDNYVGEASEHWDDEVIDVFELTFIDQIDVMIKE